MGEKDEKPSAPAPATQCHSCEKPSAGEAAPASGKPVQVADGFPMPQPAPQPQLQPHAAAPQSMDLPYGWQEVQLHVQCLHCRHAGAGIIKRETGAVAWASSLALVILGCWFIACVPLCIGGFKDSVVHCANCNAELGRRSALSNSI